MRWIDCNRSDSCLPTGSGSRFTERQAALVSGMRKHLGASAIASLAAPLVCTSLGDAANLQAPGHARPQPVSFLAVLDAGSVQGHRDSIGHAHLLFRIVVDGTGQLHEIVDL